MNAPRWIPDNSALARFRENPEAFRLAYRHHLQPATPNDKMTAGSAIHAAKNVLWEWRKTALAPGSNDNNVNAIAQGYPADVIDRAVAAARQLRGDGPGARGADQVEQIVRTYAAKYATEAFAVVKNERYVEARIHAPNCDTVLGLSRGLCSIDCFDFCGIIDGVIAFPDATRYVIDLKSTGAYLNESWETTARLGDQFVGYVAMERALGRRCDGFFVDGIHVRDAKPRKDGSIGVPGVDEDDFVRIGPVSVPDWRIERWAADVRYTLAAIRALEAERGIDNPWPIYQNWPYGKADAYREFYETPPELHNQVRAMFEVRQWSPQQVADERKVAQ